MSHDHGSASVRAGARYRSRLALVLGLVVVFMVVELVAGILTGSLALLSDAGHMGTDALGLGMALAAIVAGDRARGRAEQTFGLYRLEILAALANAVLLFAVAGYVLWEAVQRLRAPAEILSGPMLIVAIVGLAVNVVGWRLLRDGASESINVEGAFLEVVADLLGSVGVVVAGVVVALTGWSPIDPIIAAAIGLFILPRAWRLGRNATRVLIQAAPEGVDIEQMRTELASISGVTGVHDLHVWTLTSEMPVASVHLKSADADPHRVLADAQTIMRELFSIPHATLQVEPHERAGCVEIDW